MRPKAVELVSVGIALVALVFSIVSFVLSYQLGRNSAVTDVRPVLVFEYDGQIGWMLRNVGKGPALNVIVAQKRMGGDWFNPVRVPPLAAESSFVPRWLGHVNTTGLGATYVDVDGRNYSSVTGNDLTEIHNRKLFGFWQEAEIGKHWNQTPYHEN